MDRSPDQSTGQSIVNRSVNRQPIGQSPTGQSTVNRCLVDLDDGGFLPG